MLHIAQRNMTFRTVKDVIWGAREREKDRVSGGMMFVHHMNRGDFKKDNPARQMAILGEISIIFRLFSAYGTPSAIFPHTCLRNSPISVYFPPIFHRKWYPHHCYKLKHLTHLLFFRQHVYGFCLFSAYIPLIFRLFSI